MPTYISSEDTFRQGVLRKAGEKFTVAEPIKPKPDYIKVVKQNAAQKKEQTAANKEAAEQAAKDQAEIDEVTGPKGSHDFLGEGAIDAVSPEDGDAGQDGKIEVK